MNKTKSSTNRISAIDRNKKVKISGTPLTQTKGHYIKRDSSSGKIIHRALPNFPQEDIKPPKRKPKER